MTGEKENNFVKLLNLTEKLNQPKGEWDWDIVNDRLVWSDVVFKIFRIKPKNFKGNYDAFLDTVHPKDREFVNEAVKKAFEGDGYDIEHRIVLPNGTIRIVNEKGHVFFDHNGKPIRMKGTVQDITNYGRNSEEEWRNYILDMLKDLTDKERMNYQAIGKLQVKAGIFSAISALVSIATMTLIWFLSGRF